MEGSNELKDIIAGLQEHGENPIVVALVQAFEGQLARERELISMMRDMGDVIAKLSGRVSALERGEGL